MGSHPAPHAYACTLHCLPPEQDEAVKQDNCIEKENKSIQPSLFPA